MKYPFGTAYSFRSSAEHREYYNQWARRYDAEFAEYEGYDYPSRLAALFKALAVDGDGPIADIGCGTGLVGLALVDLMPSVEVYGFDISAAMLEIAARYRRIEASDTPLESALCNLLGQFWAGGSHVNRDATFGRVLQNA